MTAIILLLAGELALVIWLGRALVQWTRRACDDEEAIRYLHDELTTTSKGYRPPPNAPTAAAIHRAISHPRSVRR